MNTRIDTNTYTQTNARHTLKHHLGQPSCSKLHFLNVIQRKAPYLGPSESSLTANQVVLIVSCPYTPATLFRVPKTTRARQHTRFLGYTKVNKKQSPRPEENIHASWEREILTVTPQWWGLWHKLLVTLPRGIQEGFTEKGMFELSLKTEQVSPFPCWSRR